MPEMKCHSHPPSPFQLLDVDVLMSTRGIYKLLPGTEVVDSARVVQRVTSEVAARREMAARAVTTSSIDLEGESCLSTGNL